MRPVVGTDQHSHSLALGPTLWWVVGGRSTRDLLLEAQGHPIATQRLRLDEIVGELPSLPFQLSVFRGNTLRGDVTGPSDRPAPGTLLSVFEYDVRKLVRGTVNEPRTLHWVADVVADEGGRFEVAGLARTRYEVVALHPSQGRRVVDWDVDGRFLRIRLEGRPRLRGRVVSDGHPVSGLVVRVVPQRDDFEMVRDPMAVVAPSQVTADDGRFAVAVPAEGEGHLLIGSAAGSRVRLAYPDVSGLEDDVELGDIELPSPVELHVLTHPGCEVHSGGPVGELGTTFVTGEYDPPSGVYRLRVPEPGLWWVEANCGGSPEPAASRLVRIRREDDLRVIRLVAEEPEGG